MSIKKSYIKFIVEMNNSIFLMTKSPIHGIIKSRLAKDIGNCNVKNGSGLLL